MILFILSYGDPHILTSPILDIEGVIDNLVEVSFPFEMDSPLLLNEARKNLLHVLRNHKALATLHQLGLQIILSCLLHKSCHECTCEFMLNLEHPLVLLVDLLVDKKIHVGRSLVSSYRWSSFFSCCLSIPPSYRKMDKKSWAWQRQS